jgi:soluble lytic murein transglycosylase-like protein
VIIAALLLGCSTNIPVIGNDDTARLLAEHRLSRKSRATAIDIPVKGAPPANRGLSIEISEIDLGSDTLSALTLYRHPLTREAVVDFFVKLTGNEEVSLVILYYSDKYRINPFLLFSLVYNESGFRPSALSLNPGSVDRGLFQLNSRTFPELQDDDFYNVDTNVRHGIRHLIYCLNNSGGDESRALAIYNAGYGRVMSGSIPVSTVAYVRNINAYKERLARQFKLAMETFLRAETSTASATK